VLTGVEAVRVAAPCRADLAGGTLDIWPLGLLHPGAITVNMALAVEVVLEADLGGDAGIVLHTGPDGRERRFGVSDATSDLTAAVAFALIPDGRVRVRVAAQAPYRSGLGGSSAYGIALAWALTALREAVPDEDRLVPLVRDLEARVLNTPTGEQDHWAAVRGGVLALHLESGGNRVERLEIPPVWLAERCTVFFSGIRHHSGMINWQVIRSRLDGDAITVQALGEIAAAARSCRDALLESDEEAVASALRREWRARRRLAPAVCPPELDLLARAATSAGATAVKACGAGGGGSLLVWHPAGTGQAVITALEAASNGGSVLTNGAAPGGCRLVPVPRG
jgi:D-glycero-alpha-D-manno-heptose-7-phosphate kinase